MPIAVLFDLDDTLLWDERSVEEAFEVTCQAGAYETGVDAKALLAAVREEARALYESYDTFAFTKMIGINPFEGLWANFTAGSRLNSDAGAGTRIPQGIMAARTSAPGR